MSMCESILTIALVCTVKYLHYCDYYYTLGNDSQSTPKLIAYATSSNKICSPAIINRTASVLLHCTRASFLDIPIPWCKFVKTGN